MGIFKTNECLDCKKQVSSIANKCPHCGTTVPNNLSAFSLVLGLVLMLFLLNKCGILGLN
jgi:predicted amidophosphoribosyltransferase